MARPLVFVVFVAVAILMFAEETSAQDEFDPDFEPIGRMCYGDNEFWNDCASACPRTCEYPEARACVKMCNPSCQCEHGFIRRRDGACVRPSECF